MQWENASACLRATNRTKSNKFKVFFREYRVIEISIFFIFFCIQTESVQNGWQFPVTKLTELALYIFVVHVQEETCFGLSLTLYTIFKIQYL